MGTAEFNKAWSGVADARPLISAEGSIPQVSSLSGSSSDFSNLAMTNTSGADSLQPHHDKLVALLKTTLAAECWSGAKVDLLVHKDEVDKSDTAKQDQQMRDRLADGIVAEMKKATLVAGMTANNTDQTMEALLAIEEHLGVRKELRHRMAIEVTNCYNRINLLWKQKCRKTACQNGGTCDYSSGQCSCTPGFVGTSCETACPKHNDLVCNLRGKCLATGKCECVPDHRGLACETSCPRSANGIICHAKGTCEADGKCSCKLGTTGASCEKCAAGFWMAADGECMECPNGATAPCNNRGSCTLEGTCSCNAGFVGAACQISCAKNAAGEVCSGVGKCNALSGACECPATHRGNACEVTCPSHGGSVCNGHGCSKDGKCTCAAGFHGKACEIECPKSADGTHCGGQGTCLSSGVCSCSVGWAGASCDKKCP